MKDTYDYSGMQAAIDKKNAIPKPLPFAEAFACITEQAEGNFMEMEWRIRALREAGYLDGALIQQLTDEIAKQWIKQVAY